MDESGTRIPWPAKVITRWIPRHLGLRGGRLLPISTPLLLSGALELYSSSDLGPRVIGIGEEDFILSITTHRLGVRPPLLLGTELPPLPSLLSSPHELLFPPSDTITIRSGTNLRRLFISCLARSGGWTRTLSVTRTRDRRRWRMQVVPGRLGEKGWPGSRSSSSMEQEGWRI